MQSDALLCYLCMWRRKIAQITGEWFDDSLIMMLHNKVHVLELKSYNNCPNYVRNIDFSVWYCTELL